jgi:hypothetical protein
MRTLTNKADNVEPPQIRRARGRPRKPDALSNAQRQAAYRQRKRDASINVTVTENERPAQREQNSLAKLSASRQALAQIRLERDQALAAAQLHKREALTLGNRLARVETELTRLQATREGDQSSPRFEVMLKLLAMACKRKPLKAQLDIRESDVWRDGVASASDVSDEQMRRVAAALAGRLT